MEVYGADIAGIDGQLIKFTATLDPKRSGTILLGLAQKVVREGYQRATKAIETLEGDWSDILVQRGCTIDLSPAETPKTSSGLDLPIAIMLLQASILQNLDTLKEQIESLEQQLEKADHASSRDDRKTRILEAIEALNRQRERVLKYRKRLKENKRKYLLIGTLDIANGQIRTPQYGMFGMIAAAKPGFTVIVPEDAEVYASIVAARGRRVVAARAYDLQEVWDVILGIRPSRKARQAKGRAIPKRVTGGLRHVPDLRDIDGVSRGKRAMAIALAGGHNILLVGPPGQGKSMLSAASTRLLPDLEPSEMFELNKIYSAKGELGENQVVMHRPFRDVQSTVTPAALFGGGNPRPLPGLVSMAHNGVLLFDEINQCKAPLIEQLRNTLNDRVHRIQRARGTLEYPCRFIFAAAMNPCRCGWYAHYVCPRCHRTFFSPNQKCESHPTSELRDKCECSHSEIERFRSKLSKPLLDRIDLKVLVSVYDKYQSDAKGYASSTIRRQIGLARKVQRERYARAAFGDCNADVPDGAQAEKFMPPLAPAVEEFLDQLYRSLDTKRMEVKVLLVSRTIADYDESRTIRVKDVKEAIQLMGLDHNYFRSMSS